MKEKLRNAKGEGSFYDNPNGTVTHRKSVGFKADGKRKILSVTAASKSACIRKMKEKEKEWNRVKAASGISEKDTVMDLCNRHLKYQMGNGDLKAKSIDRRECTIENQIGGHDLATMQIRSVTSVDIEKHITQLMKEASVGESSITKALDLLNAAFDWAVRRGDLTVNPVAAVKPDLVKKLKKLSAKAANEADVAVLSDDEVRCFEAEALTEENGCVKYAGGYYCLLLLYTGMRAGEMIALRWRDWQDGYLVIEKSVSMAKNREKKSEDENNFVPVEGSTKNQKARIIQLTNEANQILSKIRKMQGNCGEDDYITPTRSGRMNTASNLEHRMKVIMRNAGLGDIKGGLHIFRKTFATRMYESGARVEVIAAYIGDLESTTRKYYIAIRTKVSTGGEVRQVVNLPVKMGQSFEKADGGTRSTAAI